ncbi:hypothetical protein EV121DRAFT_262245, partial [Schizophyllum commune]
SDMQDAMMGSPASTPVDACRATTCNACGKTTWTGCGLHIEQALKGVKDEDRCKCERGGARCVV